MSNIRRSRKHNKYAQTKEIYFFTHPIPLIFSEKKKEREKHLLFFSISLQFPIQVSSIYSPHRLLLQSQPFLSFHYLLLFETWNVTVFSFIFSTSYKLISITNREAATQARIQNWDSEQKRRRQKDLVMNKMSGRQGLPLDSMDGHWKHRQNVAGVQNERRLSGKLQTIFLLL